MTIHTTTTLGGTASNVKVAKVAHGLMLMTWVPTPVPDEICFEAIKSGVDSLPPGVKMFINSGEFYAQDIGTGNLELLSRFFEKYPEYADKTFLSVKGGIKPKSFNVDSSPENLRRSVNTINAALRGKKRLDLFESARVDNKIPVEDAIRTLKGLIEEGLFDHIGMSECSAETLKRANTVHPIAAVEIEISPWSFEEETKKVLATAQELDIAVLAYSPLGRGFLTGSIKSIDDLPQGDMRRNFSRFNQEEYFKHNLDLVDSLKTIAEKKQITPAELCIAWVASLGPKVIPLPGSSNSKRTLQNTAAADIKLSEEEKEEVWKLVTGYEVKGDRHRGPDWSGCYVGKQTVLVHERLAIVGVESGAQPLVSDDGKIILAVNGEIYNHTKLQEGLKTPYPFKTHSDCEVIIPLYREHGKELCDKLDGMFSFVLLDESVEPSRVIAARDPIGITTLYQGWSSKRPGATYFASELKALIDECDEIISFPPGHVYDSQDKSTTRYFQPTWWNGDDEGPEGVIPTKEADLTALREALEAAVRKRLMSEVPYGVLLSGGLDSSLIAAIAARETEKVTLAQAEVRRRKLAEAQSGPPSPTPNGISDSEYATIASWPQLHSFSIGLENSPDLIAARKAAHYLGTVHHEYVFTVQEGLDAIPDVIHHLETYDVTTVRASTPMYLLSRKIKAMGVKMVLSGEGSDEIFGGYLYFHKAPDATSFHQECVRRVKNLHTADCLRANKSTMAWGLEARVPFLDKAFLEVAMNIDPKEKLFSKGSEQEFDKDGCPKMEKYIIRKAFDCSPDGKPYLPHSILWRQKEQFSDGVGYSWIDGMKTHAAAEVSDEDFAHRAERWPRDTPDTKEAYHIREIFDGLFPSETAAKTAVRWIPRGDWGCASDPSGRSVEIHNAAYNAES
ncbi:hypothetical protein EW026_g1408 [Hermanssonia centrifuga]|uniref:asparagine synthase (glutamine-hydrolyzing) n=1 Tax=Hermanssonia centrifuga TaxID=98765 RepID=A0A4S4KSH4_9APHY|nr:hypothetical protein EW026_g1408 [Hermanssonia centrifuga]